MLSVYLTPNDVNLSKTFINITKMTLTYVLLQDLAKLVNHVDKITMMSDYKPRIIIRTSIGSERPLHPQHQHVGDYTDAFRLMCENIDVIRLEEPEDIVPAYTKAYERKDGKATVLVEYGDYYNEK